MIELMTVVETTIKQVRLVEVAREVPNKITDTKELDKPIAKEAEEAKKPLTYEQKEQIKKESGYSDEVIDNISCWEEYDIYRDAGLMEVEVNGRKCLVRNDIDMEQKDSMGRTNKERMEKGLPPINKEGEVIELHHIGQKQNSPLAELTTNEHRGKGNDSILHDKEKESEIDINTSKTERENHWKSRTNEERGN